ncbi:hypothetical protein D9M72_427780 [compost metagenome]
MGGRREREDCFAFKGYRQTGREAGFADGIQYRGENSISCRCSLHSCASVCRSPTRAASRLDFSAAISMACPNQTYGPHSDLRGKKAFGAGICL